MKAAAGALFGALTLLFGVALGAGGRTAPPADVPLAIRLESDGPAAATPSPSDEETARPKLEEVEREVEDSPVDEFEHEAGDDNSGPGSDNSGPGSDNSGPGSDDSGGGDSSGSGSSGSGGDDD